MTLSPCVCSATIGADRENAREAVVVVLRGHVARPNVSGEERARARLAADAAGDGEAAGRVEHHCRQGVGLRESHEGADRRTAGAARRA